MENHLHNALVGDVISIVIALLLLNVAFKHKAWALFVFVAIVILGFGYTTFRHYNLLYGEFDEVTGITNGYSNSVKSGGSIRYYFTYNEKRYDESTGSYPNLNEIETKNGRYKVRVCKFYPSFNEIDFTYPMNQ